MTRLIDGLTEDAHHVALPSDLPLEQYADTCLFIRDKSDQIIPLAYNGIQRDYLGKRTSRDIVLKARQMGFSTAIQSALHYEAMRSPARILSLMDKAENTSNMREMSRVFYEHIPDHYVKPDRTADSATTTTYANGSRVVMGTAGALNAGRSGTYRLIHGSEVAFWRDAGQIVAGALQAGSPEWVVLESTPNGATGWFYETAMEALDNRGVWTLHFYPWFVEGTYRIPLEPGEALDYSDDERALIKAHGLTAEQIKWRRFKQHELKQYFPQEYPEDPYSCFLASNIGYFGDIEYCYTAPLNAEPQEGHRYIAGIDWGQMEDFTVLAIIDAESRQQVQLLRLNRMEYSEIRRQLIREMLRWNVRTVVAEENSAQGNVESLRTEAYKAGYRGQINSYKTSNTSKAADMATLRDALHDRVLTLMPIDVQKAEMRTLTASQTVTGAWQIKGADGSHDDIPIALMLAWSVTSGLVRGYTKPRTL